MGEILSDDEEYRNESRTSQRKAHVDNPLEENRHLKEESFEGVRDKPRDTVRASAGDPVPVLVFNRGGGEAKPIEQEQIMSRGVVYRQKCLDDFARHDTERAVFVIE